MQVHERSRWRGTVLLGIGTFVAVYTIAEIAITYRGWGGHGGPYMVMAAIFQSAVAITLITIGLVRRFRGAPQIPPMSAAME